MTVADEHSRSWQSRLYIPRKRRITMFRNEEGLTLVELLVTLAVIAIVFAIAIPTVSGVVAAANTAATADSAAVAGSTANYGVGDGADLFSIAANGDLSAK
jgi:prepilin-type N-terminal cleavage/methylation domain-containing protein